MGWLHVLIGGLLTYGFHDAGHPLLALSAGVVTAVNFWSYGVMHNFAVDAASQRKDYRGGFGDFTPGDLRRVPNGVTNINLLTALVLFVLCGVWAYQRWLI